MNLDERLARIFLQVRTAPHEGKTEASLALDMAFKDARKLIRDVIGKVKPERKDMSVLNEYDRGYSIARNSAIDELESNMRDLGL